MGALNKEDVTAKLLRNYHAEPHQPNIIARLVGWCDTMRRQLFKEEIYSLCYNNFFKDCGSYVYKYAEIKYTGIMNKHFSCWKFLWDFEVTGIKSIYRNEISVNPCEGHKTNRIEKFA